VGVDKRGKHDFTQNIFSARSDTPKHLHFLYLCNMPDKEKILAEIKKTLKPFGIEKIILFGSFAYGIPNENSDIDLLVIKNIPKNETRDLRLKLKKALWLEIGKYNIPFDLLVDNDERLKKRIEMGDHFYKEIYLQGKVIYA